MPCCAPGTGGKLEEVIFLGRQVDAFVSRLNPDAELGPGHPVGVGRETGDPVKLLG